MVQRQFCLNSALFVVDKSEAVETVNTHELQCLVPTSVKINRHSDGQEDIVWLRGDIPVFDGEEVIVRKPDTVNGQTIPQPAQRQPDLEASEYCRILHVLADSRMTRARTQLMEPRTRDEMDMEPVDPLTEHLAHLFNDVHFKPNPVETLAGGVTRADISSLNPALRLYEQPAGVLKGSLVNSKLNMGLAYPSMRPLAKVTQMDLYCLRERKPTS